MEPAVFTENVFDDARDGASRCAMDRDAFNLPLQVA
jgi:hypothetical protein